MPKKMNGADLKSIMEKLGMTGRQFSKLTGYTPEHISRFCNNKTPISNSSAILFRLLAELPDVEARIKRLERR